MIKVANGSRAGDYLHLMRGDLAFELGNVELAREQYGIGAGSASQPSKWATQGGVAAADIKKLRSAAGANCALCHGR